MYRRSLLIGNSNLAISHLYHLLLSPMEQWQSSFNVSFSIKIHFICFSNWIVSKSQLHAKFPMSIPSVSQLLLLFLLLIVLPFGILL